MNIRPIFTPGPYELIEELASAAGTFSEIQELFQELRTFTHFSTDGTFSGT